MLTDSEIQKILSGIEDEDYGAPVHQEKIFIIMWQSSSNLAGTKSDLRKSVRGKNSFLRGLHFNGFDLSKVIVVEQPKAWVPVKKTKDKKTDEKKGEILQWHPRSERQGQTTRRKKTQHS